MEDVVVIGGGIVGLSTAREILARNPDASVIVLDKADDVATAQTGHNSGVIHAGIYYAPGSLKARLCRAGERATKDFCDEHRIPYEVIGKLVVATDDVEVERMNGLAERAERNGIQLRRLDADELREVEPAVRGKGALLSPDTGVVDFQRIARAMADDVTRRGGRVVLRSQVRAIREDPTRVIVATDTGEYRARTLVACAGLQADRIARLGGLEPDFRIVPFRGEYYQLPHQRGTMVSHLIYPVPDPALPFLGVHLSPGIDGRITVGPNAVLGMAREKYPQGSVDLRDMLSYTTFTGMWRFARHNIGAGVREMRDSLSRRRYLRLVRKYCPSLQESDLRPYPAGIRAQAVMRDGSTADDFLIRRTQRQVHVCNAPSPAATSAIPIGRLVTDEALGS